MGPVTLLVWLGLVFYLWAIAPFPVNPQAVAAGVASGTIQASTLETMAILLPVIVALVCLLMVAIVALIYAAFSNERRYLEIIEDMTHRQSE